MNPPLNLIAFKPRLVMLKHLTRHLLTVLQAHQQASSVMLVAPQPLQLHLLLAHQATARPARLQSQQALILPDVSASKRRYETAIFDDALAETAYDLPELHFEIRNGETPQSCIVPASRFSTFAYGNPSRQLLEFMATLIDAALQDYGFSCRRQQQRLRFEALEHHAELLLTQLQFAPAARNPCHMGLEPGLRPATDAPPPPPPVFLWWGPYQINSQRCEVCLPAEPLSSFAQRFLEELNGQLAPTGIAASWTASQHLELLQPDFQQEIQISPAERPALNPPHRYLDLPLAAGHYRGQLPPAELGQLAINGHALALPVPPHQHDAAALREWILLHLNQLLSPHHLTVSLRGESLCFHWTGPPSETFRIQVSPAFLQEMLGFMELVHPGTSSDDLQEGLGNWQKLGSRLFQDLSNHLLAEELCVRLKLPPLLGELAQPESLRAGVWLNFAEPATVYLTALVQALETTLHTLAQELPAPHLQALVVQPAPLRHIQPVYPAADVAAPELPAETPPSTFDHQI